MTFRALVVFVATLIPSSIVTADEPVDAGGDAADVATGEVDGATVAVATPPVPPAEEVAVGQPPVPPAEVAVGQPPVPPAADVAVAAPPVPPKGSNVVAVAKPPVPKPARAASPAKPAAPQIAVDLAETARAAFEMIDLCL